MSAALFVTLFVFGLLLVSVGNIIGIVQAFQESLIWGLVCLLPFGLLVFIIKFWNRRQWVRRSFFISLAGGVVVLISALLIH